MSKVLRVSMTVAAILVVVAVGSLLLYYNGQGRGTQSVSINGTKYWAVNVTLTDNLTSIRFSGVTFDFSYPCNSATPPPPTGGEGQGCANVTFIIVQCPNGAFAGAQYCEGNLPKIQVVFPDGTTEYFNNATTVQGVITYNSRIAPSRLWFTVHSGPRVGIELVTDHAPPDTLLLLVRA